MNATITIVYKTLDHSKLATDITIILSSYFHGSIYNPPKKHLRCKKGTPKKLQVPGTQCKKQKEKTAQLK